MTFMSQRLFVRRVIISLCFQFLNIGGEKFWSLSDTDMATTSSSEDLLPGSDAKRVEFRSLLLLNDFQETCIKKHV